MKLHNPPFRFVRKKYGRGRTPATRQGRVLLLSFPVFVGVFSFVRKNFVSQEQFFWIMGGGGVLYVVLLFFFCYYKGEKPKRQWGEEK